MEQPKFRGYSLETKKWHVGHGWVNCNYSEAYKQEKGIEDKALLYTEEGPIQCELASMGRFALSVKLIDRTEEWYEGDIVADLSDSDLNRKYQILWDDYGMFLFVPLFESEMGPVDYYEMEEMFGSNMFVYMNVFENPDLALID